MQPGAALELPLDVSYEYATQVLNGDCSLGGQPLQERVLYLAADQQESAARPADLGANRSEVGFIHRARSVARGLVHIEVVPGDDLPRVVGAQFLEQHLLRIRFANASWVRAVIKNQ